MGTGKAIISTPYWYATEMLAEGRGRIVPFSDPDAMAEQIIDLLDNDVERHAMRKKAYTFTRRQSGRKYPENISRFSVKFGKTEPATPGHGIPTLKISRPLQFRASGDQARSPQSLDR
jgi:hypothetical protein